MDKKIIIGADDSGFTLKEAVKEYLIKNGYEVTDVGTLSLDEPVVYYEVGRRVAKEVADKKFERGLLFCGTGMGVSLVANKFPGVYCGLCESVFGLSTTATFWLWADLSLGRRWALRWPRLS